MPVAIAAGIGAGGSVLSGLFGKKGAKDAANTQANAANQAAQLAWQQYQTTRADLSPYRDAGVQALDMIRGIYGTPTTTTVTTPGMTTTSNVNGGGATNANGGVVGDIGGLSNFLASAGNAPLPAGWTLDAKGNFSGGGLPQGWHITQPLSGGPDSQGGYNAGIPAQLVDEAGRVVASSDTLDGLVPALRSMGFAGNGNGSQTTTTTSYTSPSGGNVLTANGLPGLTFQPTQAFLEQTPGYQFNLSQGLKSIQNSAAGRGLGVSGAALKGAAQFATGLADNTLQTQQGIFQANLGNVLNPLMWQANLGQNAAAQTGQQGVTAAANAGNARIAGANALAGGTVGAANALSGGLNGLASNYLLYSLMNNSSANANSGSNYNPSYWGYNGNLDSSGSNVLQSLGFVNRLS